MAKIVLSGHEFDELCEYFKAPKEGRHIRWRDFSDAIDEVFTKKGLEKTTGEFVGMEEARTTAVYGRVNATKQQRNLSDEVVYRFKQMLLRNRLDVKSFFQDFDKHKHFKVSPKIFRQVLANLGFPMSDEELQSIVKNYSTDQSDVRYMDFINDANPNKTSPADAAATGKAVYFGQTQNFKGEEDVEKLLFKLKSQIKKDRIRLGEFFQDHDLLRKGSVPAQKFRGVLFAQKIQLTPQEYELIEKYFALPSDPSKVNYVQFNEDVEKIFTEKDLEKDPLKKLAEFKAPSILDPKDVLNTEEEQILDACLQRVGWFVKNKRLLIKPFF